MQRTLKTRPKNIRLMADAALLRLAFTSQARAFLAADVLLIDSWYVVANLGRS